MRVFITICLAGLGACATQPTTGARQYQDAKTAATVTVAGDGLIFARARPELAANAQEYLTLVPIEVNRSGMHAIYVFAYCWSTIEQNGAECGPESPTRYTLIADGRQIAMTPLASDLRSLGLSTPPVTAPSKHAQSFVAPITRELLLFVANADEVRAVRVRDASADRFELWSDGRAAFDEFLQELPSNLP